MLLPIQKVFKTKKSLLDSVRRRTVVFCWKCQWQMHTDQTDLQNDPQNILNAIYRTLTQNSFHFLFSFFKTTLISYNITTWEYILTPAICLWKNRNLLQQKNWLVFENMYLRFSFILDLVSLLTSRFIKIVHFFERTIKIEMALKWRDWVNWKGRTRLKTPFIVFFIYKKK